MENIFKAKTVNRKNYLSMIILMLVVFLLTNLIFERDMDANRSAAITGMVIRVTMYSFVVYATVKRLWDMGRSGWWAALLYVPFVNLAALVYCSLAKSATAETVNP